MKTSSSIILLFIFMLGFGGCGDNSPPSPTPPVDEDNKSIPPETSSSNSSIPKAWFGPPADSDFILALRPNDITTGLQERFVEWMIGDLDGNLSFPQPIPLGAFSAENPVYLYSKGAETGMVGQVPPVVDDNLTIPGFTIAERDARRVIVSGESNASSGKAQAILVGLIEGQFARNLKAFASPESNSSAALFLGKSSISINLRSTLGNLALIVSGLGPPSASVPSPKAQWNVVPAESAAFFGSTRSNVLLDTVTSYLLEKMHADLGGEHNASRSWVQNLANLLDSGGAAGQTFENPTGGTLFALVPPADTNASSAPYPSPASFENAESVFLVDFPKLGPILRSEQSSLLDHPTVALACERAGQLTFRGGPHSLEVRLGWIDDSRDGLSILSSFLEELSTRLHSRRFYTAVLKNDLATVQKTLETKNNASLHLVGKISPLHFSAWQGKLPTLGMCLHLGMSVDLSDDSNRTPLHMAAWSSNPDVAQLLLDYNATVDARNATGGTPAMEAARIGNPGTLDLLLSSGADLNATDARGNGLVEYAASGAHKSIVSILKRRGAAVRNPMHVAAGIGDLAALQSLVKEANATDATDGWGATPLLFAAAGGQAKAFAYLLDKGANPRAKDEMGLTLVHAAAASGNGEILSKTLSLGLDVNARHSERGATALDWAMARRDAAATKSLRAAGGKSGRRLRSQ